MKTSVKLTGNLSIVGISLHENALTVAECHIASNEVIYFFRSKKDAKKALEQAAKDSGCYKNEWFCIPGIGINGYEWRSIRKQDLEGTIKEIYA